MYVCLTYHAAAELLLQHQLPRDELQRLGVGRRLGLRWTDRYPEVGGGVSPIPTLL